MKFEEFNKLTYEKRLPLLMAIDLIMQNGRTFVEKTAHTEIIAALKLTTKNYIADVILDEIVKAAKDLASMRTCKLLEYVKRSGLDFKGPGAQESGVCPICGGKLEYDKDVPGDGGGVIGWICSDCGAVGEEGYRKVFDGHYNVYDSEERPFPAEGTQNEVEN